MIDNFHAPGCGFLSNFATVPIVYEGLIFPSVEHAYQAAKTLDKNARIYLRCLTAGQAKRYGRTLDIRSDWDTVKLLVMRDLVFQKFCRAPFRDLILATGDQHLIEGNKWHDNFWGACLCDRCAQINKLNWLGQILMDARREVAIK